MAVESCGGHGLGQGAFGLGDEAGDEVDRGDLVAEPGAAALGQGGQGVVEDDVGVVVGAWMR